MTAVATKLPREPRSGTRVAPSTRPVVTNLVEWARTAKSREETKNKGIQKSQLERAKRELSGMIDTECYDKARPMHVFMLYVSLHEHVYGVAPSELESPTERKRAIMNIGQCLRTRFGGDVAQLIDFVRWTWKREHAREVWRRENGRSGRRMGAAFAFSGVIYTDYKVERERALAKR